jgi:sterol desaturase/sphingolipid hydroxylase (fatty acid hydroxylase superfamily)
VSERRVTRSERAGERVSDTSTLPNPMNWAMAGIPVILLFDVLVKAVRKKRDYELRDSLASLAISVGFVGAVGPWHAFYNDLTSWCFRYRLFSIGHQWWAFVLILFAEDLCYYWFHRLSHLHRWWWATHVTHHDTQHFNFTTGARNNWFLPLSPLWWTAWLPLYLIGFPLDLIVFQTGLSKLFGHLSHSESVGKLPRPIEFIFSTPSNHRVHHGTHPLYLDRNFGQILIIWDRLFGTYAEENEALPRRYGLVHNVGTFNPLRLVFYPWIALVRDVVRAKSWRERWYYVMGPPGWSPDGSSRTAAELRADWERAQVAVIAEQSVSEAPARRSA